MSMRVLMYVSNVYYSKWPSLDQLLIDIAVVAVATAAARLNI